MLMAISWPYRVFPGGFVINRFDTLTNQRCSSRPHCGHAPERHLRLGRQDCSLSARDFTSGSPIPSLRRKRMRFCCSAVILSSLGSPSHIGFCGLPSSWPTAIFTQGLMSAYLSSSDLLDMHYSVKRFCVRRFCLSLISLQVFTVMNFGPVVTPSQRRINVGQDGFSQNALVEAKRHLMRCALQREPG